jgi:mycothiol synthase
MTIEIRPFDIRNATEDEYRLWNESRNRMRAEILPDDPPIPLEEMIQRLKNFPPYMEYLVWAAWDVDEPAVVAYGEIWLPLTDNLHLAQFDIHVLPEYRQQGLARQLLAPIWEEARRKSRRLMMTDTADRVPAGEAFMTRLGAERGLETHTNQLVLADLNRELLPRWQEQARERAAGFELGLWEGPYPEADIDAVVALCDLLSQQPFGDLELEEFVFTPELVRQDEQSVFARGFERWTLYVREQSTGSFAGYTEVFWNPNRPEIVSQGMTGVFPEYRNRGLGRWLKAVMLEKILAERPQAKYVRTGNADINAPMLKINTELGFKPYIAETVWQIATEQVSEYLD